MTTRIAITPERHFGHVAGRTERSPFWDAGFRDTRRQPDALPEPSSWTGLGGRTEPAPHPGDVAFPDSRCTPTFGLGSTLGTLEEPAALGPA